MKLKGKEIKPRNCRRRRRQKGRVALRNDVGGAQAQLISERGKCMNVENNLENLNEHRCKLSQWNNVSLNPLKVSI